MSRTSVLQGTVLSLVFPETVHSCPSFDFHCDTDIDIEIDNETTVQAEWPAALSLRAGQTEGHPEEPTLYARGSLYSALGNYRQEATVGLGGPGCQAL